MSETPSRFRAFTAALAAWLRTSAPLCSLTGHKSEDLRIYMVEDEETLPATCLGFQVLDILPMVADADKALYEARILLLARSTSRADSIDMIAAVEDLAAQNTITLQDAQFKDANVTTLGIQFLGVTQRVGARATHGGGYISDGQLRIIWRES